MGATAETAVAVAAAAAADALSRRTSPGFRPARPPTGCAADQPTPAPQTPAPRALRRAPCRPAGPLAHHEAPAAPAFHPALDLDVLAVGGGTPEARLGVHQRRADDAGVTLGVAPAGHATGGEELAAGGVEPPEVIGKMHDLRRVAIDEGDAVAVDVAIAHGGLLSRLTDEKNGCGGLSRAAVNERRSEGKDRPIGRRSARRDDPIRAGTNQHPSAARRA